MSKYGYLDFRESLGIRDNESRPYVLTWSCIRIRAKFRTNKTGLSIRPQVFLLTVLRGFLCCSPTLCVCGFTFIFHLSLFWWLRKAMHLLGTHLKRHDMAFLMCSPTTYVLTEKYELASQLSPNTPQLWHVALDPLPYCAKEDSSCLVIF